MAYGPSWQQPSPRGLINAERELLAAVVGLVAWVELDVERPDFAHARRTHPWRTRRSGVSQVRPAATVCSRGDGHEQRRGVPHRRRTCRYRVGLRSHHVPVIAALNVLVDQLKGGAL